MRTTNGAYAARKRGTGLIAALIGAAAVLVLAIGIGLFVSGPPSNPVASGAAASIAEKDESGVAVQGAPNNSGSAPNADLAARDEQFAVDPNRTDWSYSDNGRKVVYLTIDDGPSDKTQQVLDVLDKYDCKATFFVTGHDPDHYHMIKEAYDRGHTIGLHTMTHDYGQIYASSDAFFADLDEVGQVVKDQIGYVPCFIRFPGGSSNSMAPSGMMDTLKTEVQNRGYQYYDWNISTGDGADHTADELYGYATEGNPPGNYDTNIVMLCHDSAPKQTTIDALPRIIEYYQGMGYSFEAIDRNSWVCHHG